MKPRLPRARTCRYCQREVYFVADEKHEVQVLDATSPVWLVVPGTEASRGEPTAQRCKSAFVSHFCTCTKLRKRDLKDSVGYVEAGKEASDE